MQPYLEVKKARIARAGKQYYSGHEMAARTVKFKDSGKSLYAEYRPPEILIKHLDKFNGVPFVNDHTPVDVTPDNWKQFMVGMVGDRAAVEVVDDEIWITNNITFFDRKTYDDYRSGKVELSASYDAKFALVEDSDKVGYDTVLVDIPSVNHVALVSRARAGHNARILDCAAFINMRVGGLRMKSGFLSFLGIGKTKDEAFHFSSVLFASLENVKTKTLDAAGIEKEISGIAEHVAKLGDSEAKEVLAGAVADCYKNVEAVLAKKDEVGKRLDELYGKCQDADADTVKRVLEGTGKVSDEETRKKEEAEKAAAEAEKKEGGDTKNNDAASIDAVINATVENAFSKINDSIDEKVDAAMKRVLGAGPEKKTPVTPARASSSSYGFNDEDASYLLRGVFGNR
jgi:hypothetical protein